MTFEEYWYHGTIAMSRQEMIERYKVTQIPIKKCPIFRSLHGVLCGNCSLLPCCEHGKKNLERNKRMRRRKYLPFLKKGEN